MTEDQKLYRRRTNAWCFYDWANSAFATVVMAAVLPIYYSSVAAGGLERHTATAYWGYTTAIGLAIAAVISPIIGAAADAAGARKRYLLRGAVAGALITGLLAGIGEGEWFAASVIFIAAQIAFVISFVCYDSLLPHIARPDDVDRVSTRGYAFGYVGGGLLLALDMAMIVKPAAFGLPSTGAAVRLSFVTVAVWWVLFSIPLARIVPEPPASLSGSAPSFPDLARATFRRLAATLGDIRRHPEPMKFLLAFWLYNDGIGTIIKMATIYGTEIGIGQNALIGALLLVQFVGIPFTLLFGKFAAAVGTRPAILSGLAVYTVIAALGYFLAEPWHFWALACLVGIVQGGTQALSRSLFVTLTPPDRSAEWFGFYSVSHRFAGIAGPLLFAMVAQAAGSSRAAIASLLVFFVVGGFLLTRVNLEKAAGRN